MKPGSSTRKFVVVAGTGGGFNETYHRSEPDAFRRVSEVAAQVADGISRVITVQVKKWEGGLWCSFENFNKADLIAWHKAAKAAQS